MVYWTHFLKKKFEKSKDYLIIRTSKNEKSINYSHIHGPGGLPGQKKAKIVRILNEHPESEGRLNDNVHQKPNLILGMKSKEQ